ncbi:Peptidase M17, leucyl aminopeptidase, C-terminal,Peptidase M17, leucyl aminopeptidase, N- [Cinara cedri]|uniref:Cytosol aminopeptidase n=1 Tax=Cinara cedri TaxID=506608 RepID=A0A5E4MGX6_9HEMI|nr:Peptidase M17, leucyl aminopeptidase, C-terminal,Peptidase M17, leucyl aminopeptidase, N- [Cinara cedri]
MFLRGSGYITRPIVVTSHIPAIVGHRQNYSCIDSAKKGVVCGVYVDNSGDNLKFTSTANQINQESGGVLENALKIGKGFLKKGKTRLFFNTSPKYGTVALVGIGSEKLDYYDGYDSEKENIRIAAANGCRSLIDCGIEDIYVSSMGDSESAAEGSILGSWKFQEYKNKKDCLPRISLLEETDKDAWCRGVIKSNAQNWSRKLADSAANHMTPTLFAKEVQETLSKYDNVQVLIHNKSWAEEQKMGGLLNVAKGSNQPLAFLEINYSGAPKTDKPIVLVGKGVTFDSGGISLKPSNAMGEMRADCMGASNIVGAILAISELKLPINVIGLAPLCENMPSSNALKPGDVIYAMNGKSIQVDNTDAEGRLILADALCYASKFEPKITVDLATLTGAMVVAIGEAATGVFSTSNVSWCAMESAGHYTGDRMWRFPLWNYYSSLLKGYSGFDLDNIGKAKGQGGACTAAAFLKEFAPAGDWIHMDVAGVMKSAHENNSYVSGGMTGKPTRALVQFVLNLCK